jgi:hypothetical protein
MSLAALAAALLAGAATAPEPRGVYEIVAVRADSRVARAAPGPEDLALIGQRMTVGPDGVVSPYGPDCRVPRVRPAAESWRDVAEPNLSDLQVPQAAPRLNRAYVIDCGGAARGSIHEVLMVDARTLVVRIANGTAYAILERPLDPRQARAVEQGLRRAGFDPGPLDGRIDSRTRRAAAQFAQQQGAAYAFEASAFTEALVETLTRPTPR